MSVYPDRVGECASRRERTSDSPAIILHIAPGARPERNLVRPGRNWAHDIHSIPHQMGGTRPFPPPSVADRDPCLGRETHGASIHGAQTCYPDRV